MLKPIVRGRLLSAIAFALAVPSVPAAYDDHVQLTGDDSATSSSFFENTAGRWKKNGVTETRGPHAGEKYYVPANRILTTSNVTASAGNPITHTFGGDALVLKHRLQIILKRSSSSAQDATVRMGNLEILGDGHVYSATDRPAILEGWCKVSGTAAHPSQWFSSVSSGRPIMRAELAGGADNELYFRNGKTGSSDGKTIFRYDGDASRFFGTMRVSDANTQLTAAKEYGSSASGFIFPGAVKIANGAVFAVPAGETASIGNLRSNGGAITLGTSNDTGLYASLVVTNAIVSADGSAIPVTYARALSDNAESFAPITLAGGANGTFAADMFALSGMTVDSASALAECPEALVRNLSVAVVPGANGSQALTVSHRKVVYLDVSDGSADGSFMLDANASHWSDDSIVSGRNDYYIGNVKNGFFPSGTATFGGASLTQCGSGCLYIRKACDITVPDFRWVANSVKQIHFDVTATLSGKVRVVDVAGKVFRIEGLNGKTFAVASEIDGDGTLALSENSGAASDPRAFYSLTGLNTNFTGRIHLVHDAFSGSNKATYEADPGKYCVTLTVSDPRSLGGARSAFAQDALLLADHSLLRTVGSLTFDEPTRGWTVDGVGRVSVASGETLTLANTQVTYSGTFRKEGEGTLKLGGTARFAGNASGMPVAGANVLRIEAGSLMPADSTGCDGLCISFASGTSLTLDAAARGDLKALGLYDVKWNAPITVDGGAALPVRIALPDNFDTRRSHRFGICTVSPAAAASLDESSFAVERIGGMKTFVSRVENRDAEENVTSVTFVCDLVPSGFIVLLK